MVRTILPPIEFCCWPNYMLDTGAHLSWGGCCN
jgi:hypothetical protein